MSDDARLLHRRSLVPNTVPLPQDLPWGRIAVQHADLKLFVKGIDGKVYTVASALGNRLGLTSVQSVNGRFPDNNGNVVVDTGTGPTPVLERYMALSLSVPFLPSAGDKLIYQVLADALRFDRGIVRSNPVPATLVTFPILVNGQPFGSINVGPNGSSISFQPTLIAAGSVIEISNAPNYVGIDSLTIQIDFKVGE